MLKKFSVSVISAALILGTGCAPMPVQKDVGQINFNYDVKNKAVIKKDEVIAIVSPSISDQRRDVNRESNSAANNFISALQGSKASIRNNAIFRDNFRSNYAGRLRNALENTFYSIYSEKGFKTQGPFESFDDITYTDKKNIYLASVPNLQLNIDKKMISHKCSAGVCTEKGEVQISGEFTIKMIEPLTQQTFFTKRINLSDLSISNSYELSYEDPTPGQNSVDLLASTLNKVSNKDPLIDNTDKALVDALNEFYSKAASKIDTYISAEELISFRNDVKDVKQNKRF